MSGAAIARRQAGHADDGSGSRAAGDFRRAACRWPGRWIRCSHRLANALVGNDRDAATLEVTLLGPELEFEDERLVAVAGARLRPVARRPPVPSRRAVHRRRPDRACGSARGGAARAPTSPCRGGIAVPPVLGSRVDASRQRDGRHRRAARCAAGDRLPLGRSAQRAPARRRRRRRADRCRCRIGHATIRVLPGPQADDFAPDALDVLQSAPYAIAQNSDRMGFRLEGPRSDARARRRHHLRRDAARRAAGAGVGPADPADGRSADDRRLSEDRDGDRRRHRRRRAARRRATRSRSPSARRARRWRR